jgi:ribonuclease HII
MARYLQELAMDNPVRTATPRWVASLPRPLAGVDEAGRGPLAGPVVAAAVVAPDRWDARKAMADSKQLSARKREALFARIRADCAVGIGIASVDEIDRLNILQAALLAMQRAVDGLPVPPACVLVDGNRVPALAVPAIAVIQGDRQVPEISAASIAAKVVRDRLMHELDALHPGYGFAVHAGYGTPAHLRALRALGPCAAHRRFFSPVMQARR